MHSTIAVEIEAPVGLVFELARDVERWPALLPHYLRATVRARSPDGWITAEMVAIRPMVPIIGLGLPIAWRSMARAKTDPPQLRFVHRGGATDGMDVTWRFTPTTKGCRVSIEHHFQPRVRPWGWLVDRLFVKPIARRTLAAFKSIAEAAVAAKPDAASAGDGSEARTSAKKRM
jgi:ribosome-associated toxin RatA of RatAB toxin-antitoxin module